MGLSLLGPYPLLHMRYGASCVKPWVMKPPGPTQPYPEDFLFVSLDIVIEIGLFLNIHDMYKAV